VTCPEEKTMEQTKDLKVELGGAIVVIAYYVIAFGAFL